MNRIPKATISSTTSKIARPKFLPEPDSLTFSFAALERTEYFNLDGTCQNWASDLFDMLKNVSGVPQKTLLRNGYRTYRVHNHANATPPCDLPEGVSLKDCYQIRISTSKGGIHGVFYENTFYVIWLDPLHNMYPDARFGGLRVVRPPSTCCKDRDKEIESLQEKIKSLQDENTRLQEDCSFWEKEAEQAYHDAEKLP